MKAHFRAAPHAIARDVSAETPAFAAGMGRAAGDGNCLTGSLGWRHDRVSVEAPPPRGFGCRHYPDGWLGRAVGAMCP
jgi:hypothetical protein